MEFRFFTGRIPSDRKLSGDQGSGIEYQNVNGDFIELTKEELKDLCLYYKAYALRRMWQRDRASNHYRWVAEPTLRVSALKRMLNGYRDPARRYAADFAYKALMKDNMIQEFQVEQKELPGKDPVRITITHRGHAWLMAYDRWFLNERGEKYLREPKWHEHVDEDGYDKFESTRTRKVKALKKVEYV